MLGFVTKIIGISLVGITGASVTLYSVRDTEFIKKNIPIVTEVFDNLLIKHKKNIGSLTESGEEITQDDLNKLYKQVEVVKEKLKKDYSQYLKLQDEVYKNTNLYFNCLAKKNIKISPQDLKVIKNNLLNQKKIPKQAPSKETQQNIEEDVKKQEENIIVEEQETKEEEPIVSASEEDEELDPAPINHGF